MTEGDDASDASDADETGDEADIETEVTVEGLEERLDGAAEALEAAETEADLDDVEATLDGIADDLESADLPEAEDEDEEDPAEALADRLDDLRADLDEARGPYASDVVEALGGTVSTVEGTRWTEQGIGEVADAVGTLAEDAGAALDESFAVEGDDEAAAVGTIEAVANAVEAADLDPDEDAETIAALVDAADALADALDAAEEWDDLETREQLEAEGFYDVLGHYKDYPPEWAALKEHEQQGNVDMVLLALDNLQSDFMERHCLEALTRMSDADAFEEMHARAGKRDKPGIRALGKMAAEEAVETLVEYVDADSDPQLQKVTFRALGEIGSEEATAPLANKLAPAEDLSDEVRPYAARALGLLGDTRAVEPLAERIAEDDEESVRAAAGWALRQIGTREALEAVAEYEDDRSYLVQHEAEQAAEALAVEASA
ncbi:MAG: HEAT repeat domain-containing protein [Haloferacaceae archaeon]